MVFDVTHPRTSRVFRVEPRDEIPTLVKNVIVPGGGPNTWWIGNHGPIEQSYQVEIERPGDSL